MIPYKLSTHDFASMWKQSTENAVKINITKSSCNDLNEYIKKITKTIHLHHIKTMDKEVIAAGNISTNSNNSTSNKTVCLVHCKYNNDGYIIEIRSSNINISCALVNIIQQIL